MKKCIILCRISNEKKQADTLNKQRNICKKYAKDHAMEVIKCFEKKESGGTYLPGYLDDIVHFADYNKIDYILVSDITRFTRNPRNYYLYTELLNTYEIELIDVSEHDELKLSKKVIKGYEEWLEISNANKEKAKQKEIKGELNGRPPIGYKKIAKDLRERYIKDFNCSKLVDLIFGGFVKEPSESKIKELTENSGFSRQRILKILGNSKYAGIVNGKDFKEVIDPYITEEEHKKITESLQLIKRAKKSLVDNPRALFNKYIVCSECNKTLTYVKTDRYVCHKCNRSTKTDNLIKSFTEMMKNAKIFLDPIRDKQIIDKVYNLMKEEYPQKVHILDHLIEQRFNPLLGLYSEEFLFRILHKHSINIAVIKNTLSRFFLKKSKNTSASLFYDFSKRKMFIGDNPVLEMTEENKVNKSHDDYKKKLVNAVKSIVNAPKITKGTITKDDVREMQDKIRKKTKILIDNIISLKIRGNSNLSK